MPLLLAVHLSCMRHSKKEKNRGFFSPIINVLYLEDEAYPPFIFLFLYCHQKLLLILLLGWTKTKDCFDLASRNIKAQLWNSTLQDVKIAHFLNDLDIQGIQNPVLFLLLLFPLSSFLCDLHITGSNRYFLNNFQIYKIEENSYSFIFVHIQARSNFQDS